MSELARIIGSGTGQVADAYRGLVALKAEKKNRANQAMADLGASFRDVAKQMKEHQSWQDAKAAEDEIAGIENARKISMDDPDAEVVALNAMRVSRPQSAAFLGAAKRDAAERVYKRQSRELEKARLFSAEESRMEERARYDRLDALAREKFDQQVEQDRIAGERRKAADYDRMWDDMVGAVEKEREFNETVRHNKAMEDARGVADGPDQPIPKEMRSILEKKAGLAPGTLDGPFEGMPRGLTYRAWGAMEQNPQDEILKALRVLGATREANDYEPQPVKDARKAFEKADAEYQDALKPGSIQQIPADVEAYRAMRKATRDQAAEALKKATKEAGWESKPPTDIGSAVTDKDGVRWEWDGKQYVRAK